MTSYEEYRAGQIIQQLIDNPHIKVVTHGHIVHTLEALHLPTVASWYWQDLCLNEEDLNLPLASETNT